MQAESTQDHIMRKIQYPSRTTVSKVFTGPDQFQVQHTHEYADGRTETVLNEEQYNVATITITRWPGKITFPVAIYSTDYLRKYLKIFVFSEDDGCHLFSAEGVTSAILTAFGKETKVYTPRRKNDDEWTTFDDEPVFDDWDYIDSY